MLPLFPWVPQRRDHKVCILSCTHVADGAGGASEAWVLLPAPPPMSCVTCASSLTVSGPDLSRKGWGLAQRRCLLIGAERGMVAPFRGLCISFKSIMCFVQRIP